MSKKIDNSKWRDILSEIEKIVTGVSYRTWFLPLTPLEIDEKAKTISFACSDRFKIDVLNKQGRYIPIFEQCIDKVYGQPYKLELLYKTEEEIDKILNEDNDTNKTYHVYDPDESNEFKEEFYLNPRQNFDNFVVGANNNYAHAVCLAVAESPAKVYNPLFLYGGSGLGKTHLMHAIGHHIMEHYPDMKVLYVSSEMFTTELLQAIRDKSSTAKINNFKQKYRNVDVLLIDDIQFIEGKEATQTEFFHTFNTLYELNKQIVISSDRHPNKLTDLDERLRSRFQWNIVADVQPPDFETRVAILLNKAEDQAKEQNITIDEDFMEVIDLLAEKIKFNVREMESALTRIISFSKVFNQKITVKFAKENLKDIFSVRDVDITCETVKKAVCKKYNIKITDIESSKRKREFTYPRQIAMYLSREMTDLSLPKIGESFGGRDHTTVLHAWDKINKEIKTNQALADEIKELKEYIQ
ncbi:MAG: chromosomal replication initiator protein DnaA [Bacillota bacterium]|nr:chromosomal replication initiator protein DnaA [Bacillota bacterium]